MMVLGMLLLVMVWVVSGCALLTPPPYVHQEMEIVKDENGNIKGSKYTRTVKGLTYADPDTVILEWADADRTARNSKNGVGYETSYRQEYAYLKMFNSTKNYAVIIRSEPFRGLELGPREKSKIKKRFAVGTYPLIFHWYKIGTNNSGEKTVNISIYKGRTEPITIDP